MAEQIWNVYRARTLTREWQDAGISCAPNLSWSTPASFEFCFEGIPFGCPIAFCQARTLRGAGERDAFREGLAEAVRRVAPRNIVLYGGAQWLTDKQLPAGPKYHRLSAVIDNLRRGFKEPGVVSSNSGKIQSVPGAEGGTECVTST